MSKWLNGLMGKAVSYGKNSVSVLVNKIQDSSSREERLKSVNELTTLSDDPKNMKSIGASIPTLILRMKVDANQTDYCSLSLSMIQLFINIMSISGSEDYLVPMDSVQHSNITIFTEDINNTSVILGLFNEENFKSDVNKKSHEYKKLQYYTTKLLTILLANKCDEVEHSILQSAENISRLMDLLKLKSEMIRNQALLLLTELARSNTEIKKIIAFQDGFELLMKIMEEENLSSGGIIVQDCLVLMNNLLRDNNANQNHFRIMGCIHKIKNIVVLELSDFWFLSDDKREILNLALDTISLLVSSDNPQENQNVLESNGTLKAISQIVLYCNDTYTRLKALTTLVDLIEGNIKNKTAVGMMSFESSKPNEPPQQFLSSAFNIFGSGGDERTQNEFKRFILTLIHDNEDQLKQICDAYPQYIDSIRYEIVEKNEIPKTQVNNHAPVQQNGHNHEVTQLRQMLDEKNKLIYSYQTSLNEMELKYQQLEKKHNDLLYEHEELLIALAQIETGNS